MANSEIRNATAKTSRKDRVEASHPAAHRVWLWSIGSPLCSKANERRWVTPAIIPHSLFSVGRFLFQLFENQCYTTRSIILRTDDRSTTSCLLCLSVMLKDSCMYLVALGERFITALLAYVSGSLSLGIFDKIVSY